ncbi:MAG: type II secretion system F family protein [Firmicutes bacterium]|nr:type II secretion system F family protein [Bacillota bacterium]
MPEYKYTGKTLDNKDIKGKIQGKNLEDAFYELKKNEIYAFELEEITKAPFKKVRLNSKALGDLSRQMGTMLSAGVNITKTLTILLSQTDNKKQKMLFERLYLNINRGNSLSAAMEDCQGTFPELMINMFKAGEATGSMDKSAMKMAEYYEKEHRLKSKIKGAMTYPIILLILTIGVTLMLFTFVIPSFVDLLGDGEIPLITQILLGISSFITGYWYLLIVFIALIGLGIYFLFKIPEVVIRVDRFKLKMPIIGKLLTIIYTARFSRTLSYLYSSGVNMIEAVRASSRTIGNHYLEKEFEVVNEKIRQGNSLSTSIENIPGIEKKLVATIFIGEETGRLDQMLDSMATNYDYDAEAATNRLISILEPAMIIVMTLIVGSVLMGVMLPMMTSYSSFI